MDSSVALQGLLTIGVGAIAGGITNAVAIWMLFHPYEPRGWRRLRLHGAIPKNKARLARSIGRTVGEKLLTPDDLLARLRTPAVRGPFDEALGRIAGALLETERGPLATELPPRLLAAIEEALSGLGDAVADRVAALAATPAFHAAVTGWVREVRARVADRPVGADLTAGRREAVAAAVEHWLAGFAERDDLEATLRHAVGERLERLAADERPLLDRLPAGLLPVVEQAIADYLPVALERLGALLRDPEARRTVETALRGAFDRSVRDLLLHERLLAKLVVTDRTIERLVDGFEAEGFERFADAMGDPEMAGRVGRAMREAALRFLQAPLRERLGRLGPARRAALERTLADWLVELARLPATRRAVAAGVERLLDGLERRTWGEVLGAVRDEQVADVVVRALAGDAGRRAVADLAGRAARALLARPVGRPADWLPAPVADTLRREVPELAWQWVERQLAAVVGRLDIPAMVEERVLGFSTRRMEEIVRTVTQRELDLIVRLGYVLGAIVGTIAFLANLLVG